MKRAEALGLWCEVGFLDQHVVSGSCLSLDEFGEAPLFGYGWCACDLEYRISAPFSRIECGVFVCEVNG